MLHDSNLTLETLFYRSDYVYAERFPKKLNVYISGNIAWTINNLCTLLNELPDLMNTKHSFIKRKCKKKPMIIFHFENPENNEFYLFIKITDKITVQVSTYWIKDKWNLEDKKFESDIGSNNRIINKEKMQKHIRFTTTFQNISESSLFFLNNCSLLYFSKYNFSKILHFFVKRVYLVRQPIDSDFESVDNYVRNFCEGSQKKFNTFEDIKDFGIKCYILLNIQKKLMKEDYKLMFIIIKNIILNLVFTFFLIQKVCFQMRTLRFAFLCWIQHGALCLFIRLLF